MSFMAKHLWKSDNCLGVMGTGLALPGDPVSTDELLDLMENRFRIPRVEGARAMAKRMGIERRHICRAFSCAHEIARPGQSNPELAAQAIQSALDQAGMNIADIGYIISHTTTPLSQLPPNAALVADHLKYHGPYIELRQACTGFANALMVANGLVGTLAGRAVVIVGSETGSLFFDPERLKESPDQVINMMQMGDGAGAIILACEDASAGRLTNAWFGTSGVGCEPGISMSAGACHFDHDFASIARNGHRLFDLGLEALAAVGQDRDAVDLFLPHQVNGRIGELLSRHSGVAAERIVTNADRLGNTGSASIWIALAELRSKKALGSGATVAALGAEASKYMFGGFVYRHAN